MLILFAANNRKNPITYICIIFLRYYYHILKENHVENLMYYDI